MSHPGSLLSLLPVSGEQPPVAEAGEIDPNEAVQTVHGYQEAMDKSWVMKELKEIRNTHAAFHWCANQQEREKRERERIESERERE